MFASMLSRFLGRILTWQKRISIEAPDTFRVLKCRALWIQDAARNSPVLNLNETQKNFTIGLIIGSVVFLIQKGLLVFIPAPFIAESLTNFVGYLAVTITFMITIIQTLAPTRGGFSQNFIATTLGLALPYDLYTIYGFLH